MIDGVDAVIRGVSAKQHSVVKDVMATTIKAAINVEEAARESASGLAHAPAYPQSITHDVRATLTGVEAEIGPDKGLAQGALGNLIEYGSVNNPPHNDLGQAHDAEEPVWVRHMTEIAGDVW